MDVSPNSPSDSSPQNTPFRTLTPLSTTTGRGVVSNPQSSDQLIAKSADVEPTLSIWAEINGVPYTAEHFGMSAFMGDPVFSDVSEEVSTLDNFIRNEISDRGLQDTPASYQEIIKSIEEQIGKYENEKPLDRFKRISTAASAIARLRSATKKPILDIEHLSLREYETINTKR